MTGSAWMHRFTGYLIDLGRIVPDVTHDEVLMERRVHFGDGSIRIVSLNEPVLRYEGNPILTAHQVNAVWTEPHLRVVTAHNAGVAVVGSETVMLFRSHLRSGISVIGLARSGSGIDGWRIHPSPFLKPATADERLAPGLDQAAIAEMEAGGVEDPRINPVDGTFAITYSGYSAAPTPAVRVLVAVSDDFTAVTRYGPVAARDMRNVVLFPERIDGRYVGLFRPNGQSPADTGGSFREILIGYATDFRTGPWEIVDEPVMRTHGSPSAFADKIGPCAPPVKTPHGWLNLFHGVRTTMDGNPYVLGVALHDLRRPDVLQMSSIPVLFPSRADCRVAETSYVHVPNVVFSCAMLRRPDGTLLIYYGGNDTVMNVAISHEDVLAELCRRYGQDPRSGRLSYAI
jgi:predicted GH43/DUF377 family glycosyl hydrolase